MKAVRGAEITLDTLRMPRLAPAVPMRLQRLATHGTDERLFTIFEALTAGGEHRPHPRDHQDRQVLHP